MPLFKVTVGWTGVLGPFTLALNGNPVDLTGMTVELTLRRRAGSVTPGGTTTPLNQTTNRGQVTYTPHANDFTMSGNTPQETFLLHWKVTDGAGEVVFFPEGAPEEVTVFPA